MLKNYLKVTFRHLMQNKGLSFINIFGLATGMAFAILIGLWIQYETSFDNFHANRDRIAMVIQNALYNNERTTMEATSLPLYYEMKYNFPEVKRATRMGWTNQYSLLVNNKKFKKEGINVDPDFLEMFSFPVIKGNIKTALTDPNSIVITSSLSKALFGTDNAIGKRVRLNNQYEVQVSAVLKDVPKNSTITFDLLAPYEFMVAHDTFIQQNKTVWTNNFLRNAIELKEGVSMEAFSKKIHNLVMQKDTTSRDQTLLLHPMSKWHLRNDYKNWVNTEGKYAYVKLFGLVGIFVLLIACINFMNLSTARSEKRAKEVGIRKAIGSLRSQLIVQFLAETLITAFMAFILALIIIPLVLPFLKDLGFENIYFDITNVKLLFSILMVAILTGLVAGSYPALYLSSFLPVRVLKGMFIHGHGAVAFRKILVVSQFAISIGLIISTVIVFQQVKHARDRSLGYNPDNLININTSTDLISNYNPLKQDLLNTGYVEAVTRSSGPLTAIYNTWGDFDWTGKDPHAQMAIDAIMTDMDYEKTVGLKFIQGRPFSKEFKTDSNAVILNEAAVKIIGYKDPIGKSMKSAGKEIRIVGVVEDMLIQDPFKPVHPCVIMFIPKNAENFVFLRLKKTAMLKPALAAIQPIFEKYNPAYPFEFNFSDEEFNKKFTMENQVGKLAAIFAALAILISCLGLFGLAAFMAERRTKEIGIRKVLGASIVGLWALLSKEFVWLVMLGCIIASPLAFWLMKDWLQKYDYRIDISWWIFAVAAGLALIVALVTVSTQALRAALSNPVKSLRSE